MLRFGKERPRGPAGPQLSSAVSDRDRADAEGAAGPQDRRRHAHRRRSAPRRHRARRAGRKPDAHRRREHRRCRFLRALADQAERRRRISVQHPESRRHREGRGRKRDARGDRPLGHSADPDRRAPEHRSRGAGADAEDARHLQRRRPGPAGSVAEGRSAGAGHRLLPRRAGGARRPRARAERSADLRQPRGARSARPRGANPSGRRRLQVADRRRGDRPDLALQQDLRRVQEGARGDAQAHVSRNHGTRARRHRQDHPRLQRAVRCPGVVPYLPLNELRAAASARATADAEARDEDRNCRRHRPRPCSRRDGARLFVAVHRLSDPAGAGGPARSAGPRGDRARSQLQGAADRQRDRHRQTHPRSRKPGAGGDRLRSEAPRGRRLRALSHPGSAALLPDRQHDPGRQLAALRSCSTRRCGACWARRRSPTSCATSARS